MSVADIFEVNEDDTVWDAWLTTVNLIDILEHTQRLGDCYNFKEARQKVSKINHIAELHQIDREGLCKCGLSVPEHSLVRRKIMTFYIMQVNNLKRFLA